MNTKEIGQRFKIARERLRLKPRPFAITGNIDVSQYSKLERGIGGISIEKVQEIATKHGINVDFITTGKGQVFIGEAKDSGNNDQQQKASNNGFDEEPSLKQIVMVLAQGFTAQAETIRNIEKNMARQESQAIIEDKVKGIESSLNDLSEHQRELQAQLLGSVRRAAERFVGDDQKKTKAELDKISIYAAQALGVGTPKGIPPG